MDTIHTHLTIIINTENSINY